MIGDVLAPTHLLLILIVALVVLGPKRLPEVGRSLGRGLRDFREAMNNYTPDKLLSDDDEPSVHAPEAEESELRTPVVPAATAHGAPSEATTTPQPASAPSEHTDAGDAPLDGEVVPSHGSLPHGER